MSLFKMRDWWSTVSGYEEFHTNGSLTIAPVATETDSKSTCTCTCTCTCTLLIIIYF